MERDTPTPRNHRTGVIARNGWYAGEAQEEESHRGSQDSTLAEQVVHSSEKRLHRRQVNYRPINPERLHKIRDIQNADLTRGQAIIAKRLLDGLNRPQGRLLARTRHKKKETILGISLEEQELAVQSYAFRPKRSPTRLHQSHSTRGEGHGRIRNLVPTLSGRSLDNSINRRRMPTKSRSSHKNPRVPRMVTELGKISSNSSTEIHMAGGSVRPMYPHSNDTHRKDGLLPTIAKASVSSRLLLCEGNYETTRSCKLGRTARSNSQTNAIQNKKDNQSIQEGKIGYPNYPEQRHETQSLQVGHRLKNPPEPGSPISRHYGSDRRLTTRMGISDRQQSILGKVRQNDVLQHQHFRNANNMVFTVGDKKKRDHNPDNVRQLLSHSSKQERLIKNSTPGSPVGTDMEESSLISVDSLSISHSRSFQCVSGSVEQRKGSNIRMVPTKERFPENPEQVPTTSSGPICHQSKQQTSDVHLSLPGQESSSSRCTVNTLGQLGSPISLPTDQIDFEGFSEVDNVNFQERSVSYSRLSYKTLVYGPEDTQSSFNTDGSSPPTGSCGYTSDQTTSYETSRMAVIKSSYEKRFPDCRQDDTVDIMSNPIRMVSIKEYQRKWEVFIKFLKKESIPLQEVNLGCTLRFFTFLFVEKRLMPGTVSTYRSALSAPLKTFNVHLTESSEVSDLIRGMKVKRPSSPVVEPHWSLNTVLTFIEIIPEPLTDLNLLRKSAFLLLLATGWRISELHACVREEKFCNFTYNSSLRLRPHPCFLAKNESSTIRWEPLTIKTLIMPDGTLSKLCPVSSLKEYLDSSTNRKSKVLFQPVNKEAKLFTSNKLGTQICKLILEADPLTKVKVHDVRKYAASQALAQTMLVGDVTRAMGWSGTSTFFKYYLSPTEPLTVRAALPVRDSSAQH